MKGIFFLFIVLLLSYISYSQTLSAPSRVEIIIEPIHTSIAPIDSIGINPFAEDTVRLSLMVELPQTTNISKIHVKTGSVGGGTDYANKAFNFDVTGDLGDGTSYKRMGKVVYLDLGEVYGIDEVYAEVKLENTGGIHTTTTTTSYTP